jgi:hypothetical protein
MKDRLIGVISFWLAAIVPFVGLFILEDVYGAKWFVTWLPIYALIYRPTLHILRLLSLNAIEEKDAWKLFIPFYQNKYLKTLWLG